MTADEILIALLNPPWRGGSQAAYDEACSALIGMGKDLRDASEILHRISDPSYAGEQRRRRGC